MNYFGHLTKCGENADLIPVLPGASTVTGFVSSSDVGKLVVASSNNAVLAVGTTADANVYLGIVAAVPVATTPASTQPFYIRPILRGRNYEGEFSTSFSTAIPATTDIGKYVGLSNTTTPAGAKLDMGTIANAPGSTSGCFFKITGFSTERRILKGVFNSSHLDD